MKRLLVLSLTLPLAVGAQSQASARVNGRPVNEADDARLRGFRWRSVGPVQQGGRVDDIAVNETDRSTFYVGFATGGIWRTTNNGVTFEPIFDHYGTHSIGDIAIAPSRPEIVYVGTGEPNQRQSSSFGDGVYKSTDGGNTFTHAGLRETQTIGRVVVHPRDPNVVWVAAAGALFGPSPDRGVYKSNDGGRTWRKTLFVEVNTGAIDIVIQPGSPDVLVAATYERRRTAWGFNGGGSGSGIWRSTDGGERWTRLTGNGLPAGIMGRIGLEFARSKPNVLYAQIEVAPEGGAASGIWRSDDAGGTWRFMSNQNNRPSYYSKFRVDPNDENTIYSGGAGAFKSTDGGRSWTALTGFGHGDHHAFWIDPTDSDHVIDGNDGGIEVSWDGGKSWRSPRTNAVGQAYHVSMDMRRPYVVCTGQQDNGSWCGPSSVRSGPILTDDWYRVGGGDGFYTQVDPSDYRIVYAEGSNGASNRINLRDGSIESIRPRPSNVVPAPPANERFRFNWSTPIVLSPHDPAIVYTGAHRIFTSRDRGQSWTMSSDLTKQIDRDAREVLGLRGSIPACGSAEDGARRVPCILSKNDGVTAYGTIVTIAESPVQPGVLWVGTDDGNIQVTRDGGHSWTEVSRNLPGGTREVYVSRVEPSRFDAATAYISLDAHRGNDLRPYVFVTRDFGRTWTSIAGNLPAYGNVNTVKQDPRAQSLLYVGTEFGFFVSLDEGRNWSRFMTNLPVVRVDDVVVHPRDNDLVVATHGRSIWIMDDVTPLQQLAASPAQRDEVLFRPRAAVRWIPDIRLRRPVTGDHFWEGEPAPPGTSIAYWLERPATGSATLTIRPLGSADVFRTLTGTTLAGMNQVRWDLCGDARPLRPGESRLSRGGGGNPTSPIRDPSRPPDPCYHIADGARGDRPMTSQLAEPGPYVVTLSVNGREVSQSLTVLQDVWMEER
jgi:photosystem II stability/assembly factor-like uncharacterized protein